MERLELFKDRRHVDAALLQMALTINDTLSYNPAFVTILKGGLYTSFHMLKNISLPERTVFGYLGLSSYREGMVPRGTVEVTYDYDLTDELLSDKDVWIIDDICDAGETLDFAKSLISTYNPKSIKTVVLIDKKENRERHHFPQPNVIGFTYMNNKFLVGCGMGHGERYRHLRELYELILE